MGMFCGTCGEALREDAKFCPKCGCSCEGGAGAEQRIPAERPAKPNTFFQKHKKLCIVVAVLLVIMIAVSIASGDTSEQSEAGDSAVVQVDEKYMDLILNRKLFLFRDATPEYYTGTVALNETTAWQENWTVGQILNGDNFKNITWNEAVPENNEIFDQYVVFSGDSILSSGLRLQIIFGISDGMEKPVMISMRATTEETVQDYDIGDMMDDNTEPLIAMAKMDAFAATMIVMLAEDAAL